MKKNIKILGIVSLSIFTLYKMLSLLSYCSNLYFNPPSTSFQSGYAYGGLLGQLFILALCIFGFVKLLKSLKPTK